VYQVALGIRHLLIQMSDVGGEVDLLDRPGDISRKEG
jgi:hypothetical protein